MRIRSASLTFALSSCVDALSSSSSPDDPYRPTAALLPEVDGRVPAALRRDGGDRLTPARDRLGAARDFRPFRSVGDDVLYRDATIGFRTVFGRLSVCVCVSEMRLVDAIRAGDGVASRERAASRREREREGSAFGPIFETLS